MPAQSRPPCSQHRQLAISLEWFACSGHGSLNRSKMTPSLPLKVVPTDRQNGTAPAASGIGFSQVACAEGQAEVVPVYLPSVQCKSRIATMPLALRRLT